MAEDKKTQVIMNEEAFKDEESAYPGAPLSDNITEERIKEIIDHREEYGNGINHPNHPAYGHMAGKGYTTDFILLKYKLLMKNPERLNHEWDEVTTDAIKFAATISMEEDLAKIQDALHKFIDVEDPHSKFIRKALARTILKTEMKSRVNLNIDCKKMLDDREYSREEVVNMLNTTYGAPKKFKCHPETSFASMYVKFEGDGVK